MYMKATTLTENYKAAYILWRETNPDLMTNRYKITDKPEELYLVE
jgi:hypothetical protein